MPNTTTSLPDEVMIYLMKDFLERAMALNIHREGLKETKHTKHSGKTVSWNRYDPLATKTTPLAEGTTPAGSDISSDNVRATVEEYGDYTTVSSLLNATALSTAVAEKEELMAQNAGETLDDLARDELFAGATTQFANGKTTLSSLADTDVLTVTEVRRAIRQLKKKNAPRYSDGYYLAKVGPDTAFDVMSDSTWIDVKKYNDKKDLYKGELGSMAGARFLECTSNQKSETSTTEVYSNFFHGRDAVGKVELVDSNKPNNKKGKHSNLKENLKLYVKTPNESDTSNPLNMYTTVGWKCVDAVKTLNSDWVINVKTGATE